MTLPILVVEDNQMNQQLLVRQLVELMRGRVTLVSLPGSGTTFGFTIPCIESGQKEAA
jgi:CheY-like chemotaxis protein